MSQSLQDILRRFWPAVFRRLGLAGSLKYNHRLSISGRSFLIPVIGGMGEDHLKLKPDFKSEIIKLFGDKLPNCFIDVGANLGQTVLDAFSARNWDRYFAFEPNPIACAYLDVLVKTNRLPVEILPWAAGPVAAPLKISFRGTTDPAATMAPQGRPGTYSPEMSRWVATYPLDLMLDLAALPAGVLLKIDVEGFEANVLAGASRILSELRPLILCEVLRAYKPSEIEFAHARMSRVEGILASYRYRIFSIQMENETSGPIQDLREIASFPRGLFQDNPSGMDYLFLPEEVPFPAFATGVNH